MLYRIEYSEFIYKGEFMNSTDKEKYIENLCSWINEVSISEEHKNKILYYSNNLLANNRPVIFDKKHIYKIFVFRKSYTDFLERYYHCFYIDNINKKRLIKAPSRKLKSVQKWILDNILVTIEISKEAYGFVKGRSIYDNAKQHCNNQFALCIDIKDFFGSIYIDKVLALFIEAGYSFEASQELSKICCCKDIYNNYVLPQGAPTSPYIANIVCKELDEELSDLAKRSKAVYTRYADDITFSAQEDISELYTEVYNILKKYKFRINDKTRYYTNNNPKFITGLVVQNGKVRVPKKFKRDLRKEIYYCKRFGVDSHLENSNANKRIHYREYLYGKAYYINMVEPDVGRVFLMEIDSIIWPDWALR